MNYDDVKGASGNYEARERSNREDGHANNNDGSRYEGGGQAARRPLGGRPRIKTNNRPISSNSGYYNSNSGYSRDRNSSRPRYDRETGSAGGYDRYANRDAGGRRDYRDNQRNNQYDRPRYRSNEGGRSNDGYGGYEQRSRYNSYDRNEGGYDSRQPRQYASHNHGERREGEYGGRQPLPYRPQHANGAGYPDEQRHPGGQQAYRPTRPKSNPQAGAKKKKEYDPNGKYSQKKRIEYRENNIDPNAPIRLNKYLANAGVCSRRDADKYIAAGVVAVNGQIITDLGTKVLRTDEVRFHDDLVSLEKKVYILLNKPKGYVTTSDDPQKRKTVMDLVKNACPERIYPIGRLDRNTTGVLLLTNDGEMAAKLTHPKFMKKKVYHVFCDKNVAAADMRQIADGVTLEDGEIKADAIEYASFTDKKQVGIEIHSGKNRIVRRIFEHLGYRVTKLDRVYFAGLTKKNVKRGDWRYLTEEEVIALRMGAFE